MGSCPTLGEVLGFPGGGSSKELACQCRRHKRHGFNPYVGKNPLKEGMVTHSNILAWRVPRTEEPGELWSIGLQRVGHDWKDLVQHIEPLVLHHPWPITLGFSFSIIPLVMSDHCGLSNEKRQNLISTHSNFPFSDPSLHSLALNFQLPVWYSE